MDNDIERFRLPSAGKLLLSQGSRKSSRQKDWFLKGPIPGPWLQAASGLPGRALHVGLAIWFLVGLTKSCEVKPTNRILKQFSTPPDAYRRGLKQLESAGLVTVKRASGRCSLVTVLEYSNKS